MTIIIRPASKEDLEKLVEADMKIFGEDGWDYEQFEIMLQDGDGVVSCYSIIEADGKMAAYGGVGMGKTMTIENLAVYPEYRNRGYGTMLIRHFLDIAEKNGYMEVFLEVDVTNTAAISLYKSLGFRTVDTLKGYYASSDAYYMKLDL